MWSIEVSPRAEKSLRKLDKQVAKRCRDALLRLSSMDDPSASCKPLRGPLSGWWRYRVGNYRMILDINRNQVVIVALDVGHRSDIYD